MSTSTITIAQGSDLTVRITDLDDLTGATGHLAVMSAAGSVVITKSTDDADEGMILEPEDDGAMEFYIVPADTSGLAAGTYYYDAWVVTATERQYQVRSVSQFIVQDRVVVL